MHHTRQGGSELIGAYEPAGRGVAVLAEPAARLHCTGTLTAKVETISRFSFATR
jgi:hypothetical protein